jgi:L-lactate dehydrogenase complex protein LldF
MTEIKSFRDSFVEIAEEKSIDAQHRKALLNNIRHYEKSFRAGRMQFNNLELAKSQAASIKWDTINKLDKHLTNFEKAFVRNGGKIIWAKDKISAQNAVKEILERHKVEMVIKSKSMITEELELNDFLSKHQIQSIESDLGELVAQLENIAPYHIVTPIIQKTAQQVAETFHHHFGSPLEASPAQLVKVARKYLRSIFTKAGASITGANFLIAETGGIALTENEGNIRLCTSFPKVHIAISGIEKVIPKLKQLGLFWPLLATYGTGQNLTAYNTIIHGPAGNHEDDGPEHLYLVLVDNGRTEVLKRPDRRAALHCIKCGACYNVCPVYKTIGGHAYKAAYGGPIGSVITPIMEGFEERAYMSEASSICGKCSTTCPVKIDIHRMLIENRAEANQNGYNNDEKWKWKAWRYLMLSRTLMNLPGAGMKSRAVKYMFGETWNKNHEAPVFTGKTFNQLWKKGKV